ncbi:MAG: autotransporter domain-containing protein [Fusobacteriaceae bacterium]
MKLKLMLLSLILFNQNLYSKEIVTTEEEKNSNIVVEKNVLGNMIRDKMGNGLEKKGIGTKLINKGVYIGQVDYHSSNGAIEVTDSGNGVREATVNNEGIVKGKATIVAGNSDTAQSVHGKGIKSGNGIIGRVETNTGLIEGNIIINGGDASSSTDISAISTSQSNDSGNGIEGDMKKNIGIIKGSATVMGGTAIAMGPSYLAMAETSAIARSSGNGIDGYGSLEINVGLVEGSVFVKGGDSVYSKISSDAVGTASESGNGISNMGLKSNEGVIRGSAFVEGGKAASEGGATANASAVASGNGILGGIETNAGLIKGTALVKGGTVFSTGGTLRRSVSSANAVGNGVYGDLLSNTGVISGYLYLEEGTKNNNIGIKEVRAGGSGFAMDASRRIIETNKGVIKGSQSAVAIEGTISGNSVNYGIMAGREIFSEMRETINNDPKETFYINKLLLPLDPSYVVNKGVYINLDEVGDETSLTDRDRMNVAIDTEGDVIIEKITNSTTTGDTVDGREIINATVTKTTVTLDPDKSGTGTSVGNSSSRESKDSYIELTGTTNLYDKKIINGAGNKTGTLTLLEGAKATLTDSIVNAYKTAVTIGENAYMEATDTIFNGGGLKSENPVIVLAGEGASLEVKGKSIINGSTEVKGNDSRLSISNNSILNGDLISKGTGNTLNLGDEKASATSGKLSFFNDIKGFSNINVEGKVEISSQSNIDKGDITLSKTSKMIIDLDGTKTDSNGAIIGHALYSHTGKIKVDSTMIMNETEMGVGNDEKDSKLVFKASGLGTGAEIAMNGTNISSLKDYDIGTSSIAHTGRKIGNGNVFIDVKNFDTLFPPEPIGPSKPTNPRLGDVIEDRDEINKIYDSIKNSKQIGMLAPTTDTTDGRTDVLARQELLSLLDQIYGNTPYAFLGEASKEAIDMFRYSHQYTPIPEIKEKTVTGTALSSSSNFKEKSLENIIGGEESNHSYERDIKTYGAIGDIEYGLGNNSSVGLLVGGANQKVNFSGSNSLEGDILYLGVYYRKVIAKSTFELGTGYQYATYDADRTISNRYQSIKNKGEVDTNSVIAYGEVRYLLSEDKGLKVEPKLGLSLVHIEQGSVSEKSNSLSIDTKSTSYDYIDTELGVDVTKEKLIEKGKLIAKGTLSYINSQGSSNEKLTGKMSANGGTDFKMLGPELSENNGKIGLNLIYEKDSGVSYSVGVDYKIGDKETESTYVNLGVGYKF